MTEHIQESKKTQAEEQEEQDSDDSSRSPGVTDRELINVENSSKAKEIKQSTQESQTKSSETENKD